MRKLALALMLASVLSFGCSTVKTRDVFVTSGGQAETDVCHREYSEGVLASEDCVKVTTHPFSAWKIVMDGIFTGLRYLLFGPSAMGALM